MSVCSANATRMASSLLFSTYHHHRIFYLTRKHQTCFICLSGPKHQVIVHFFFIIITGLHWNGETYAAPASFGRWSLEYKRTGSVIRIANVDTNSQDSRKKKYRNVDITHWLLLVFFLPNTVTITAVYECIWSRIKFYILIILDI